MRTSPAPASAPVVPRSAALRYLLHPHHVQASWALTQPPSMRIALVSGLQTALAVLLAMVVALYSPWPELVGFAALGALSALFGRFAPVHARLRIVATTALLMTGAVLIPSLAVWGGVSPDRMMLVLAVLAGLASLAVSYCRLGAPGATIIVFGIGAAMGPIGSVDDVWAHTLATAAGGVVACVACAVTDWLRKEVLAQLQFPASETVSRQAALHAAGRVAVAAGVSAAVAYAAGWSHPAWAAIGATAVMQGTHLHTTLHRALQRMAGTMVGAAVVWWLLAQEPPLWVIAACIVGFQFLTEVLMGFNYALGQATVTPLALLMTYLASPSHASNMPVERVLETILGATLGIVFAVIFSTMEDRRHLAALAAQRQRA